MQNLLAEKEFIVCKLNEEIGRLNGELSCLKLVKEELEERLPFQSKRASVKIAMERGIFFEIMYSPAISNFRSRREMFSSAKVLINYTHGRNIIVSSAASRK